MRPIAIAFLLALLAKPLHAIDEGVAWGSYQFRGFASDPDDDRPPIEFRHAIALGRDGADQMAIPATPIRVVLTDVEVPVSAIRKGLVPLVEQMAYQGKLKGLMLEFDPADLTVFYATVLDVPAAGLSHGTITKSGTSPVWKSLTVNATRVTGEIESEGFNTFALRFSAPIFTDPVTERVEGPAVAASPQLAAARGWREAFARRDMTAARSFMSLRLAAQIDRIGLDTAEMARSATSELAQLARAQRVIVRGDNATIFLPDGATMSLVRIDGTWKVE